jgi:transcriptional regulator with XRE-family HTH domain
MTVIPIKRDEMAEDSQYTRLVADLLGVARGFCDYGEEKGLLTPDGLKFAVTKRKEVVKQLADAGKSQREIAELVGVSAQQINRDLNGRKPSPKVTASVTKGDTTPETEPQEDPRLELMNRTNLIRMIAEEIDRELNPDLVDSELITSVRIAAEAWNNLADKMERML